MSIVSSFAGIGIVYFIVCLLGILEKAFAILFIKFSSEYRNEQISALWYVLAFFFPVIAVIAHLIVRKNYNSAGMKVCAQCGEKLPPSYQVCPRCLAPLGEYDETAEHNKEKKAKGMLTAFFVSFAVTIIAYALFVGLAVYGYIAAFDDDYSDDYSSRIAVIQQDGSRVYYDKMGVAYNDPKDVVLYSKDGDSFIFDEETYCYVGKDGGEYYACYSFVDADGWFYYDKDYEIEWASDEEYENTDELPDFSEFFSKDSDDEEKYYECIYTDSKGNLYYDANEASWNENGELITAENDVLS